MSCGCENRKKMSEIDRTRTLAKKFAVMESSTVVLYQNADSTYGFTTDKNIALKIIEYITPY